MSIPKVFGALRGDRKPTRLAMWRFFRKRHPEVGSQPGTLVLAEDAAAPTIRVIDYDAETVEEREIEDLSELRSYVGRESVTWIDVQGLGDEQRIREIGEMFSLHPLAVEDLVHTPQHAKAEQYEDYTLIIAHMPAGGDETHIETEQVGIVVGRDYLLTFQERYGDVFDVVRDRIRHAGGPIRRRGPDYLCYALLDTMIDAYYPLLEAISDHLEGLEDRVASEPPQATLKEIYATKRELLAVRRTLRPQREAVTAIMRDENPLFSDAVRVYLRDCYDHTVQIIDVVDTYRELAVSLAEVYMSAISNQANEVMKVLTVMASIFIPLTFIAGIYGMNFAYMPELHHRHAYPVVLIVMGALALVMLVYFRLKRWIGPTSWKDRR
jgi:magnesium transporter